TGATGVQFTTFPALWTATSAASFSTNPVAATREYEVCFKCHSSFAFGATAPTPPGQGDSATQQTDVAMEFNPNNRSMHPVVSPLGSAAGTLAPKALVAAQLLAPWNVNVGTQTMTCTDCHNTDAASPAAQGPHGSAIAFLLAGTNKAWPYTVAGTTGTTLRHISSSETGIGTANGLFCRNCHPQPNSTASNGLHRFVGNSSRHTSGNNDYFACVSCHIRIPHGGKVSRLIRTANAPARYGVTAVSVGTPIANFTKLAKDSYGQNAGWDSAGCNQHANVTTGEAW
ncbi:MAG TPA: hypothetical protein VFR85_14840, partial [Anaeromyxobacteraceae bacterium]|nr:hypothetical protein [Anaeromyxobacteraceae bacterium]